MDIVDETYEIPEEWNKLKIKSIHKKGSRVKRKTREDYSSPM